MVHSVLPWYFESSEKDMKVDKTGVAVLKCLAEIMKPQT